MYLQIKLVHEDGKYHKTLWRERPEIHSFLNTVMHRTATALYLAIKSVHQLVNAEETWYPKTVAVYKSDFYVDDFKEACDLRDQLTQLIWRSGFELQQWSPNDSYVVSSIVIPCEDTHIPITLDETTKIDYVDYVSYVADRSSN